MTVRPDDGGGARQSPSAQVSIGPIDRSNGPAYVSIEKRLAELIEARHMSPGDRLPGEHGLARSLGVSRMTLRQALGNLERRRLVTRKVGRNGGTFVSNHKLDRDLRRFSGLSEQLRRHGMVAGAQLLAATEKRASRATAAALELARGSAVFEIRRLRLADNEPVALECSTFPAARFPELLGEDLTGSIYELLRDRYGEAPSQAVECLELVEASAEEASALDMTVGAPLLSVERTAYGDIGIPLELAHDLFRGDRTRMVVWTADLHQGPPG
ncbi:MAG: GntR family transcriptional regulator [Acidimicrobiales bacterium]